MYGANVLTITLTEWSELTSPYSFDFFLAISVQCLKSPRCSNFGYVYLDFSDPAIPLVDFIAFFDGQNSLLLSVMCVIHSLLIVKLTHSPILILSLLFEFFFKDSKSINYEEINLYGRLLVLRSVLAPLKMLIIKYGGLTQGFLVTIGY